MVKVTIDEKKNEITLVLPLEKKLEESGSGRNLVVASTHGTVQVDGVEYQGEVVKVGANVLIRNRAYKKTK